VEGKKKERGEAGGPFPRKKEKERLGADDRKGEKRQREKGPRSLFSGERNGCKAGGSKRDRPLLSKKRRGGCDRRETEKRIRRRDRADKLPSGEICGLRPEKKGFLFKGRETETSKKEREALQERKGQEGKLGKKGGFAYAREERERRHHLGGRGKNKEKRTRLSRIEGGETVSEKRGTERGGFNPSGRGKEEKFPLLQRNEVI